MPPEIASRTVLDDHPSPWQAVADEAPTAGTPTWHVEDANGAVLATGLTGDAARFIAAAPDVFNALGELLDLLDRHEPLWYLVGHQKRALVALQRASPRP